MCISSQAWKYFIAQGKREKKWRQVVLAFQGVNHCRIDSGVVCQITVDEERLLQVCITSCANYVKSMYSYKSFNGNNCHVYQQKYERLLSRNSLNSEIKKKSTLLLCGSTCGCELDSVGVYLYASAGVSLFCKTWLYCHDCCIVHRIFVYFVITMQESIAIIIILTFFWPFLIYSGTHN